MKQIIVIIILITSNIQLFGINVILTYKVTIDSKQDNQPGNSNNDNKDKPGKTISIEKYVLFDDGYMVKQDSSAHVKTIYDFNSEKVTTIRNNFYDIVPLFSIINYRATELQNREFLSGALKAGGLNDVFGGLFGLETLLVIEDKPNKFKSDIKEEKNNNNVDYYFKKDKVVKVEYSNYKLDGRFRNIFTKLLIYNTNTHPLIINSMVQNGFIPKYIGYSYSNADNHYTVKYELIEFSGKEESLENLMSTKGLSLDTVNCDSMELLINKIYYKVSKTTIPLLTKDECIIKNKAFIEKEKYLDALLTLFEYLLQSGDQPADAIKQTMIYLNKDKDLKTFVDAINSEITKEALQKSIHKLESIDQNKYEKGYLINIFLANFYTNIGFNKSWTYFHKVLVKNPYVTGVYKDLGEYYSNNFDMDNAWKCFDIAVLLNKNNPISKDIENLKSKYRTDYPAYFISKTE